MLEDGLEIYINRTPEGTKYTINIIGDLEIQGRDVFEASLNELCKSINEWTLIPGDK